MGTGNMPLKAFAWNSYKVTEAKLYIKGKKRT